MRSSRCWTRPSSRNAWGARSTHSTRSPLDKSWPSTASRFVATSTAYGKSAFHMVSAWVTAIHINLGQVVVNAKSNEITAIPKHLELLEICRGIVTIDYPEILGKSLLQLGEGHGVPGVTPETTRAGIAPSPCCKDVLASTNRASDQ